jgi:tRNA-dihydrouridine synthase A
MTELPESLNRRLSVAPMMDCTDRFYRYLARLLTRRTLLYTEMVTTGAVLHGDRSRLLGFDPSEHPVALQLGGADPGELARAAQIGAEMGFDEINLNVGCPSDRVQSGRFGACLMAEPDVVADSVKAMGDAVGIPVTVKTRIGIDDRDSFDELSNFVEQVADAGCRSFAIHARKAWLQGLSPKQNREIPPLRYDVVRRLKSAYPDLEIILNGGVESLAAAAEHLAWADGVMVGRAAYHNPWMLAAADQEIFGAAPAGITRADVVAQYLAFARPWFEKGISWSRIVRPLIGLFHGQPGGRIWRQRLSGGRQGATDLSRIEFAANEIFARPELDRQAAA